MSFVLEKVKKIKTKCDTGCCNKDAVVVLKYNGKLSHLSLCEKCFCELKKVLNIKSENKNSRVKEDTSETK